jgi:hypothetical protein
MIPKGYILIRWEDRCGVVFDHVFVSVSISSKRAIDRFDSEIRSEINGISGLAANCHSVSGTIGAPAAAFPFACDDQRLAPKVRAP